MAQIYQQEYFSVPGQLGIRENERADLSAVKDEDQAMDLTDVINAIKEADQAYTDNCKTLSGVKKLRMKLSVVKHE